MNLRTLTGQNNSTLILHLHPMRFISFFIIIVYNISSMNTIHERKLLFNSTDKRYVTKIFL